MSTLRIAVLVSGTGSNLRAIAQAIDAGSCDAKIIAVISDKAKAKALSFATERGIPTAVVPLRKGDDRELWNEKLAETIESFEPQLVVLAGFMRVLGDAVVQKLFPRIVNVHPSLLPAFGGHNGPEQALAAGVRLSGCSVHIVDSGVDTGPILAQAAVPVFPSDDVATLHARIQQQEHLLLPKVIHWIARGNITLEPLRVEGLAEDSQASIAYPS